MVVTHSDKVETRIMEFLDQEYVSQVNISEYLRDTRMHKVIRNPCLEESK